MFQRAIAIATEYTFPFLGLRRKAAGPVYSTVASFVVLNEDGWFVTSGHVVDDIVECERQARMLAKGEADEAEANLFVSHHSEIWGLPGSAQARPRMTIAHVDRAKDLAVARLEPFDRAWVNAYPVLRDTAATPVQQGLSVCRLGFPFHDVAAGFDVKTARFELPPDAFPAPLFALDGIVSRFHRRVLGEQGTALFIETSTPGLRGQSGGPLTDVDGRLCGIQSHTEHLDLGFDARYRLPNQQVVTERQFLNVGAASHVDELRALLDRHGVGYRSA